MAKVHDQLKVAIQPYHIRLNRNSALANLTSPQLSASEYHNILLIYSFLYAALENRLHEYLELHPTIFNYKDRIKHQWLLNDLAFLDIQTKEKESKFQSLVIPKIEHIGQLIGVLYAIEGSTLGGQVISRCLEKNKGLTSVSGARFFNGYGQRTKIMWQEFLCFAETISEMEEECQAAVNSACETFCIFEQTLGKLTPDVICIAT